MTDPVIVAHNEHHRKIDSNEISESDSLELVDQVISHAALYLHSECAEVVSEAAKEECASLMALMSMGIDLDVHETGKLTVGQLMALAAYALDLRRKVIKNIQDNHDLEYLARGK